MLTTSSLVVRMHPCAVDRLKEITLQSIAFRNLHHVFFYIVYSFVLQRHGGAILAEVRFRNTCTVLIIIIFKKTTIPSRLQGMSCEINEGMYI